MLKMEIIEIESDDENFRVEKSIRGDVLRMRVMKNQRVDVLCAEGEDRPKYCDFFSLEPYCCLISDEGGRVFDISLVNAKHANIKKFEKVLLLIIDGDMMRIETDAHPSAYEFSLANLVGKGSENAKPLEISVRFPSPNRSDDWDKLSKRSYELGFSIANDLEMVSDWIERFDELPRNAELMTFITDSEIEIWSTPENAVRIPLISANNLSDLSKEVERILRDIERFREKIAKKENEENDGNTETPM